MQGMRFWLAMTHGGIDLSDPIYMYQPFFVYIYEISFAYNVVHAYMASNAQLNWLAWICIYT